MPAKFIGIKEPDKKLERLQKQVDKGENTLLFTMSRNSLEGLKQSTPVDTGNMLKSWKKSPLTMKNKTKTISVFNTATNKRTGFLYPIALEYGFHHYAWGTYVGFRAGLFFRERNIAETKNELPYNISVFNKGCMRVWK